MQINTVWKIFFLYFWHDVVWIFFFFVCEAGWLLYWKKRSRQIYLNNWSLGTNKKSADKINKKVFYILTIFKLKMSTVVFDQTPIIQPLITPGDNTSCLLLFLHQSAWRTLQWDEMRVMRVKPASCVSHAVRSRLDSHHTLFSHGHIKKAVK